MNDIDTIRKMLENVGLHVRGIDANFIYIEDPACILRGFENFLYYAWMVLGLFTAGLIIGWGISMIRGAKNDIKENFKTLILIFGILTAVWPILNVIYGGDLLGMGCKTTRISVDGVNEILATRVRAHGTDSMLYEDIDIYDSGTGAMPKYEMPELEEFPDLSDLMNWTPDGTGGGYNITGEINRTTDGASNYANMFGEFSNYTNSRNTNNNRFGNGTVSGNEYRTNGTSNYANVFGEFSNYTNSRNTNNNQFGNGTVSGKEYGTNGTSNYANVSMNESAGVAAVNSNIGEITYTAADGTRYTHIGGSLTWRANNPGALRNSDFTRRMGAIGVTLNGFAIFPNAEAGRRANVALLKTDKYQNKTLAQAIQVYAPSSDGNNPASYAARLARAMGVSVNTYLRDMSDIQIERMAEGIRRIEGWRAGDVRNN